MSQTSLHPPHTHTCLVPLPPCNVGVKFKRDRDKKETVLLKTAWCECDGEERTISGTFDINECGAIYFTWDNSVQSWISKKRLNYRISMRQDLFSSEDSNRQERALALLADARDSKDDLLIRLN